MANKKHEAGSLETLIGQDSIIRGEIISKGVVRLDGTLEGSIKADYLILGRSGSVKGDMAARGRSSSTAPWRVISRLRNSWR